MLFQDVQDALVGSFAAGHINEKEFVILYEEYQSANLCFPYWEYEPFRLDDLDNSECRADFRVEKEDIPRLATALQIPPFFRYSQGRRRFVFAPTKAFLPMSIPRYNPLIWPTST